MITPTRIEVRNVRSVAHAAIEPLTSGITALSGPIGTGKSSLINGALWALYGEVGGIAGLLSQNEMRRKDCPEKDPVEAIVEFTLDGTDYKAVRRLRQSKSGKETASAEWWIDGKKQPQITPTKLTEKVTALTGLTGRAFTGAFFIPQGNLPVLAEGTPSEVQRLIEEQTGLTPLTRQVDSARRQAKDAQIVADAQPGSREAVDAAQGEVDAAQKAGEQAWAAKETAEAREAKTKDAWQSAQAEHDEVLTRDRAARQAREDLAGEQARLDSAREQVQTLTEQARQHPVVDTTTARDALTALRAHVSALDDAVSQHQYLTAAATTAATKATSLTEQAQALPDVSDDLTAASSALNDAQAARGAAKGEWDRLSRAITALRATSPQDACCPTCTQHLPDPMGLMQDLTAHQNRVTADGVSAATAMQDAQARIDALNTQAQARNHAHRDAEQARAAAATAEQAAGTAHTTLAKALTDATAAVAQASPFTGGLDSTQGTPDSAQVRAAAQRGIDAAQEQISTHTHAVRIHADLDMWTGRVTTCQDKITALTAAVADAPSEEQIATTGQRAATARAAFDTESAAASTARTEARVAAQAATGAEHARNRAQADLDAKVTAALHADTLRHAADLLAALRKDLLADYTATISASATDLMAQVGGGTHTGVVIDQTFTPCVTLPDGTLRPMRVLSGGEKMRAALCLRLGIADQITGGSTGDGMIFADEITANHDPATTAAVVDLIRGLGRPMLVIAHADEVDQAANRVYRLAKPTESTGTQVSIAGAVAGAPATAQAVA